jgi:hypothetical protein
MSWLGAWCTKVFIRPGAVLFTLFVVGVACGDETSSEPQQAAPTLQPAPDRASQTEPGPTVVVEPTAVPIFELSIDATATGSNAISVRGSTNLPDGASIRISAQRALRKYGETSTRASSLQPDGSPLVRVSQGAFSLVLNLDERFILAVSQPDFATQIVSSSVTVCATFETGIDNNGRPRQTDPRVLQIVGRSGEALARSPNVTVFGSRTANPSNWLEVSTNVALASPALNRIASQQGRPVQSQPLEGFCGA